MSPKVRHTEGQFNLFNQPELSPTPTVSSGEAVHAPETSFSINKEVAQHIGVTATASIPKEESPLRVDLITRGEAMLEVLDGIDKAEPNKDYAVALLNHTDPRKKTQSSKDYNKILGRKGMDSTEIARRAELHRDAQEAVSRAFDTMWGTEVIDKHGDTMGEHPVYEGRSSKEVVSLDLSQDKYSHGVLKDTGKNTVTLHTDEGVVRMDQGEVVGEGFITKHSAEHRLNPATGPDRLPLVTKKQAKAERSKTRVQVKEQLKTLKKIAEEQTDTKSKDVKPATPAKMWSRATKVIMGASNALGEANRNATKMPTIPKTVMPKTPDPTYRKMPTSMPKSGSGMGWSSASNKPRRPSF